MRRAREDINSITAEAIHLGTKRSTKCCERGKPKPLTNGNAGSPASPMPTVANRRKPHWSRLFPHPAGNPQPPCACWPIFMTKPPAISAPAAAAHTLAQRDPATALDWIAENLSGASRHAATSDAVRELAWQDLAAAAFPAAPRSPPPLRPVTPAPS